jgi:hypothetical protein
MTIFCLSVENELPAYIFNEENGKILKKIKIKEAILNTIVCSR